MNTEDIALCVEDTLESYKKAVSSEDNEESLNSLSPISRLLRDSRRLSSVRHEDMIAGQMLASKFGFVFNVLLIENGIVLFLRALYD